MAIDDQLEIERVIIDLYLLIIAIYNTCLLSASIVKYFDKKLGFPIHRSNSYRSKKGAHY